LLGILLGLRDGVTLRKFVSVYEAEDLTHDIVNPPPVEPMLALGVVASRDGQAVSRMK